MNDNACIISQQPTANSYNYVLVSIIIPAYNTGEYIHRAIESSLRQTHSNVEVIVVDDGSKDNTLEVAQSYAERDSRVRVFHKENGGVSSARNMGIRESHGEYMIFLDSDDWLEDDAVEVLTNLQEQYPLKLIASGKYFAEFHNDGKIYRVKQPAKMKPQIIDDMNKLIGYEWGKADQQSACYKMFISDVIRSKNILFNEKLHNKEDGLFVFEYLHHMSGLVYVDAALWIILARPGSATSSYSPKMTESAVEAFKLMMNYPGNTEQVKEFWILNYTLAALREIAETSRGNSEDERITFLRLAVKIHEKFRFFRFLVKILMFMNKCKREIKKFFKKSKSNSELVAEWLQ